MVSSFEESIPSDATEYLTLMRDDDLQVRSGYCYYILNPDWIAEHDDAHINYSALARNTNSMRIMCVHRLWMDSK